LRVLDSVDRFHFHLTFCPLGRVRHAAGLLI
jgi:hypothetical protein